MSEKKEVIVNTLQEIQDNMELFYQQKNEEALNQFNVVLGKMMTMIDSLFAYRDTHDDFILDEKKIQESLTMSMKALEDGDMILLADIIQYEFVEYMDQLIEVME